MVDVEPPAKPLHRPLKGFGRAVGAQCDDFTVENHLGRGYRPGRFNDFGNRQRDLTQIP